jgi:hypothetical protein
VVGVAPAVGVGGYAADERTDGPAVAPDVGGLSSGASKRPSADLEMTLATPRG